MKILKISGKNIASLAKEFCLDLEAEPLGTAGLFAITGPTGTGKTALLDTMCLALFDQVPRFRGGPNFKITDHQAGDETLSANDVKHFLRKGAAGGFAKVQFLGVDNRIYEASWEIRRARNKVSGKIQDQIMSLLDVAAGTDVGDHRKTETLKVIREKLGLDFDQFCRSVLLAQGEFAAFLKANAQDRSELLERMTGTQIYSKLSAAAFQRHKQEKLELDTMEQRFEATELMSEDTRRLKQQSVDNLAEELKILQQTVESHRQALAWYQTHDALTRDINEAEKEHEKASQALVALDANRRLVDIVAATLHVLPHLEARDREQEAEQTLLKTIGIIEAEQMELALVLKAAETTASETKNKAQQARDILDQAHPHLARARALDTQLAALTEQRNKAQTALDKVQTQQQQHQQRLQDLAHRSTQQQQRLEGTQSWLSDHLSDHLLTQQWEHWERQLQQLARDLDQRRHIQEMITAGNKELKDMTPTLDVARTEQEEAQKHYTQVLQAEEEAKARFDRFNLEGMRTELEQLTPLEAALAECVNLLTRMDALNKQHGDTLALIEEKTLQSNDLAISLEKAERQLIQCEARRQEAEKNLATTRETLSLESRRPELLQEGAPCPLCGSIDHPYRTGEAPTHPLLTMQKERVAELVAEYQDLIRKTSADKAQSQEIERKLQELHAASLQQETDAAALTDERHANAALLVALGMEENPAEFVAMDRAWARTQQRLDALTEECKQADKIRESWLTLRGEVVQAADRAQKAVQRRQEQERHFATTQDKLSGLQRDLARAETSRDEGLQACAPLYTGERNRDALAADPQTFLDNCRRAAQEYQNATRDAEALSKALEENQKQHDKEAATLQALAAALTPRRETTARLTEEWHACKQERAGLFDGQDAATVEHQLRETLKQAETAADQAHAKQKQLLDQQLAQSERLRHTQDNLKQRREDLANLNTKLAAVLVANQLDEATATAHRHYDQTWLDQHRRKQQEAREAGDRATTVLQERRDKFAVHEAKGRPETPQGGLTEAMTAAQEQSEAMQEDRHRLRLELEADTTHRAQLAEELPRIEKQRQHVALWSKLNDLIGSSGGAKFRKYAQSLTLDMLLAMADTHLSDLAPRYSLQRVPQEDLELQVLDRHMADDIRPLNSLSGGETFLVSLALALGLSTLSADRVNIASLFIDEGFGTLDSETLDVALSALDNLQASGRQIGIISHLGVIADRLGVRVKLVRTANGSSRIDVVTY